MKKILDVTCGSRTIWFDKHHPDALFLDRRVAHERNIWGPNHSERICDVEPDIVADFTELPFVDGSFALVVFDPPHLLSAGNTSWMVKKYGKLDENWPKMIHDGFRECMRVLRDDGILIFKWSEVQIPTRTVIDAIRCEPLFGHRSGKQMHTHWLCYMKGACPYE